MSLKHGPPPPGLHGRRVSHAAAQLPASPECKTLLRPVQACVSVSSRSLKSIAKCQIGASIPSLSHHITTALAAASASSPNSGQARRRWYCETGHTKTPRARSTDITAFPDSCTLPETQYRPGHFHDNEIPWILLENGSAQRNRMEVDDLGFVPQQDCERCR